MCCVVPTRVTSVCVCAAIELIKDLVEYEVRGALLKGLVKLLRPTKEESIGIPEIDLGT